MQIALEGEVVSLMFIQILLQANLLSSTKKPPQSPDSELYETVQIELINSKLEKVFSISTKSSTTTIPIDHLSRGNYYLNFTNKEGVLQRQVKIER